MNFTKIRLVLFDFRNLLFLPKTTKFVRFFIDLNINNKIYFSMYCVIVSFIIIIITDNKSKKDFQKVSTTFENPPFFTKKTRRVCFFFLCVDPFFIISLNSSFIIISYRSVRHRLKLKYSTTNHMMNNIFYSHMLFDKNVYSHVQKCFFFSLLFSY